MAPNSEIEGGVRGNRTPAVTSARVGHRVREIRQQVHERHHAETRYRVAHAAARTPAGRAPVMLVSSDEYQIRLYTRSRSTEPGARLAAVREAIATSPYTWEELAADGVREWIEESLKDGALVAAAAESLGDLEPVERAYLGKFTAERIYEMLRDAEADFWYRTLRPRRWGLKQ
jgi:hypothetical protein